MKPPYKVLFSNDTTNIESCVSPYNTVRLFGPNDPVSGHATCHTVPFSKAMLNASVDETAGIGIDAHLLQPGVGWVPWWKSRVHPFADHVRFMREKFGKDPSESGYAAYMAGGGDIVGAFVRRCREKGLAPFVSLRLNDSHGHEFIGIPPDSPTLNRMP